MFFNSDDIEQLSGSPRNFGVSSHSPEDAVDVGALLIARIRSLGNLGIHASEQDELTALVVAMQRKNHELQQQKDRLLEESYIDSKTGLYSFKHFQDYIAPSIAKHLERLKGGHERRSFGFGSYVFGRGDINAMNMINEALGHEGGDRIIFDVAQVLKTSAREYDWVGRYGTGADEFSVLLRVPIGVNPDEVVDAFNRRITKGIAAIHEPGLPRPVSISFGFREVTDEYESTEQLVAAADQDMYKVKNAWKTEMRRRGVQISNRVGEE